MLSIKHLQSLVNEELNKLDFTIEPIGLYKPVEYVLSAGGKRLRPVLVLMGCNLYSDDIDKAIHPAIGLEIFHNFTLLHDDIMDKSDLRRNQPTVHIKWNDNTAILSGDAMSILAYKNIAKCSSEKLPDILDIFSQTALEVCEGQQYDMDFESRDDVTSEEYIRMIELKTSVLIAASLKIGAIIGGAPMEDANHLYEFGRNIGLAFQLQDDYLDVYGDTDVFGKKIGGDILSNKKTYLLIQALENAKGEAFDNLQKQINAKNFIPEEKIKSVTDIYNKLGIKDLSRDKMLEFHDMALSCLNKINLPESKKTELQKIAATLLNRLN